jgi:hypothetical protein
MHVAEFPQCSAGFEKEGGVLSDTFKGFIFPELLADAEFSNDRLVALGIVSLEVVQ